MAEFKFSCPVCGQHITADSSASGSQLECPTCYRKIVVPQAPTEGQKFILSAAEANKPRPISTPQLSNRVAQTSSNKAGLFIGLAVLLLGGGALAFFLLQKKNQPPQPASQNVEPRKPPRSAAPDATTIPGVTWTLDLSNLTVPETNAAGRIHGREFNHELAILQGNQLTLRHGASGLTDLGVAINLPSQRQGDQWSGQQHSIDPSRPRAQRVQLRWTDDGKGRTRNFTNGYALKLEFGQATNRHIAGKIYLCTPDDDKSVVAGIFDAEIRPPAPPKPKTPGTAPQRKPPRVAKP